MAKKKKNKNNYFIKSLEITTSLCTKDSNVMKDLTIT